MKCLREDMGHPMRSQRRETKLSTAGIRFRLCLAPGRLHFASSPRAPRPAEARTGPPVRVVVLPAGHGLLVDRLANLGDAGRANRPIGAMEFQAGRIPFQPAGRQQPPGDALEVGHRLLVIDLVDRHRQHRSPVVHQPAILAKAARRCGRDRWPSECCGSRSSSTRRPRRAGRGGSG